MMDRVWVGRVFFDSNFIFDRDNQCNHRLRGSASPVLTATGFVNGKGQFSTPHRIDTTEPITKKIVTDDYVGDPYGCAKLGAYPSKGAFWAHGWNITRINFIYTLFMGTHLQVRHRDGFSRMMAQTTRTRARMCFFRNFSHCSPFRGLLFCVIVSKFIAAVWLRVM